MTEPDRVESGRWQPITEGFLADGCTVTIQTWAEAQVSELGKSRVHLYVFVVAVVIPAIASALAFSARWGLAGFIIGVMVLAN